MIFYPKNKIVLATLTALLSATTYAICIPVSKILSAQKLQEMQNLLTQITCDEKLVEYIVSVVCATRPAPEKKQSSKIAVRTVQKKDDISKYISFGASSNQVKSLIWRALKPEIKEYCPPLSIAKTLLSGKNLSKLA